MCQRKDAGFMAMGKYHAKEAIFPHGHEAGVFALLYDVRYRWKALSMGFPSVYSMPRHSDMASHRIKKNTCTALISMEMRAPVGMRG